MLPWCHSGAWSRLGRPRSNPRYILCVVICLFLLLLVWSSVSVEVTFVLEVVYICESDGVCMCVEMVCVRNGCGVFAS